MSLTLAFNIYFCLSQLYISHGDFSQYNYGYGVKLLGFVSRLEIGFLTETPGTLQSAV